jgi:FHA domain
MQGFIKCPNNHFYKEELSACPFCPTQGPTMAGATSDLGRTAVGGASMSSAETDNMDRTKVGGMSGPTGDRTVRAEEVPAGNKDFNRTFISMPTEIGDSDRPVARATRKIVGWLISYTLDPMGVDYRVYEGNNSIGRGLENSIVIPQDTTISTHHATILYRDSQGFFIKDEMSANGTFLNGNELEVSKAFQMKDGDEIKMAKTVFKFKSAK